MKCKDPFIDRKFIKSLEIMSNMFIIIWLIQFNRDVFVTRFSKSSIIQVQLHNEIVIEGCVC